MPWRLRAYKNRATISSSSKREELIKKRAKRLRKNGWRAYVYEVKN